VNKGTVKHWKESLPYLPQGYELKIVSNAGETGLFYSLLSSETFRMKEP
jgi:hypothetical protein